MPLDGSNNYYYPLGTPGVPNQTIESEKYNTFLDDLVMNDLNVPRPVSRGGTGASTPEQARTNLGVMSSDGGTMTNSIIVTGTITASTGASAGTVYLGTDQVHYLQWNGTTYTMPSGPLLVGGAITALGTITAYGGSYVPNSAVDNAAIITTGPFGGGITLKDGAGRSSIYAASGSLHFATSNDTTPDTKLSLNHDSAHVLTGALNVSSSLHFGGTLTGGVATLTGAVTCAGISCGSVSSTGNISTNSSIIADAGIDCNNLTTDSLTVGGNAVWHAGNFSPASYLPLSGGTISGALSVTGDIRAGHGTASGKLVLGNTGQNLNFNLTNSDGWRLQGGAGGFHIDTNAVKPGGGTWDAPSDGRIKDVLGDYEQGLAAIRHLKPQRFKYTDRSFDLVKDREFIGFVAQDVEPVMPEMVRKKTGVIDGKEVQDFRMTDTTALIYALVNAVRELSNRVEELESAG